MTGQKFSDDLIEREYAVYWDPTREGAADDVKDACAAELTVFEGGNIDPQTGQRQIQYQGISATLRAEPVAA